MKLKRNIIASYTRRAIARILTFCNRADFPEPLELLLIEIVEDMLKSEQLSSVQAEVSSITRGDTAISYRDKSSALTDTVSFMKSYESQLIP